MEPTVRMSLAPDRAGWIDVLTVAHGDRVGVEVMLSDLNRAAVRESVPVSTADYGFRWNDGDVATREWWPQGVTTSADANESGEIEGRLVVVVSWYAKQIKGASRGTRLTFVDVTDAAAPRYRHVRLVQPTRDKDTGEIAMSPVRVHAGGIVWYGRSVLVADTTGGIRVFRLDDLIRVEGGYDGYPYVLPQRTTYQAEADDGFEPFRWSFVSLDRGGLDHRLIAGEYGVGDQTTRLVSFGLDRATDAPAMTAGLARPQLLITDGLTHMQGAALVDGTFYLSTSRGRKRRGSLWARRPGEVAREHKGSLAVGPEDLTYWPQRDQLWNLSEHPGHRYVYAVPRTTFT